MLELLRKQTLLTESFGISVDINKDNALALIELNEVQETAENQYTEKPGVTFSLDYEELDEIIAVLQYASDQLKQGDNQFANLK